MDTKSRFPDEATLRQLILQSAPSVVKRLRGSLGGLEDGYRSALRDSTFGIVLLAVGFFIAQMGAELGSLWAIVGAFVGGLMLMLYGGKMIVRSAKIIATFNARLDQTIFPIVAELLGFPDGGSHSEQGAHAIRSQGIRSLLSGMQLQHNINPQYLDDSELITEPHNTNYGDDVLVLNVGGSELVVQELDVRHVTGSGKNRNERNIFRGYFVMYQLPTVLKGKTFISTEGDRDGFGHQTFWSNVAGDGVEATELEWNDFENMLHVSTTEQVEARYILTPDFMHELYQWWIGRSENIRLSFIGDKFYLLFPSSVVRIGRTIKTIFEGEVQHYLESIALPLLHVLCLVEDVQARFYTVSGKNSSKPVSS